MAVPARYTATVRVFDPPPEKLVRWFSSLTSRERLHVHVLIALIVGYVAHFLVFAVYFVEDSGITFAIARNWANGEGLVPVVGGERVEAFSNPSWTFLIGALSRLGIPVWTSAKVLGAVLGAICLPLSYLLARECRPEADDHAALLPPFFLAASSTFVIWNASGLENPLFNVLLAGGMYRTLVEGRAGNHGRFQWSAVLFLLLAISRPEGICYAAVGGLFRLVLAIRQGHVIGPIAMWLGVFWVPFAAYHAWRFDYFAWEWPNTYYAKLDGENRFQPWKWKTRGWRYMANYGKAFWLGFALPVYLIGLTTLRDRRRWLVVLLTLVGGVLLIGNGRWPTDWIEIEYRPTWWGSTIQRHWETTRIGFLMACPGLAAVATVAHRGSVARLLVLGQAVCAVFFVLYSGGDWMKQWRWASFLTVPNFVLLGIGLGELARALPRWKLPGVPLRFGAATTLVLTVVLALPNTWQSGWTAPEPETTVSDIHKRVNYMTWVRNRLHLDRVVLLDVDMGAHMWFTDWEIVDIAGLIDVPMARHIYQRKFIEEYVFGERVPTFAHVHAGWANKSKINKLSLWNRDYVEIPGYPANKKQLHIGNHIRKDIFVQKSYTGPEGREVRYAKAVLEGWDVPSPEVPVGGRLYVEFTMTSKLRKQGFRVLLAVSNDEGDLHVTALPPGYDWLPPEKWKTRDHVVSRYDFPLPEFLEPGRYDLGLVVLDVKSGEVMSPTDSTAPDEIRWMQGAVWFDDAFEIVTRDEAMDYAERDRERALTLASDLRCEQAWEAWRMARWHVYRNKRYHQEHQPDIERAVADCHGLRSDGATDETQRIEELVAGRKWDHHSEVVMSRAVPLAEVLEARGDTALESEDWETAFLEFRNAVWLDPRRSSARRKTEATRDLRLDIEPKVKDSAKKKADREARAKERAEKGPPPELEVPETENALEEVEDWVGPVQD
jgi:hypothetical protein